MNEIERIVQGEPGITLNNLIKRLNTPETIQHVRELINSGKITALNGKIMGLDVHYLFPGNGYKVFQGIET